MKYRVVAGFLLAMFVLTLGLMACSSSAITTTPTSAGAVESPTALTSPGPTSTPVATPEPASGWRQVAPMNVGRTAYSATMLSDGRLLVVGGLGEGGVLRSAEIYDLAADAWATTGDTVHPHRNAVLETLADGRVVVAGGLDSQTVATAEIFDPATGIWTELPPMRTGRESAMAVPLSDGRLLVFGGANGVTGDIDGTFELASAEIFDPITGEWNVIEPIAQAEMSWEGWTKLDDDRVLLAGGDFARPNRYVQVFDPTTDSWLIRAGLDGPIGGAAAVLLPDETVLLAGGGLRCCLRESQVYDLRTGEWTDGPEMLVERGGHIGLHLPDGRVVLLFGLNPQMPFDPPYRNGEIYDPATGDWELLPDYPGVFDLVNDVVVLGDGSIFQGGGRLTVVNADGSIGVEYSTDAFLLVPPKKRPTE